MKKLKSISDSYGTLEEEQLKTLFLHHYSETKIQCEWPSKKSILYKINMLSSHQYDDIWEYLTTKDRNELRNSIENLGYDWKSF
jgi:hypothetical protein